MCLKYFVRHSTCDHHEYLGSHHCSLRPCDLDTQHFHYIEDDFPVPWPEDLKAERSALACKTCTIRQGDTPDLADAPVQSYAPTNDFQVKEVRPTGRILPVKVVRVEEDDETEPTTETQDSNDNFDYDYKSLSDADDEEWAEQTNGRQNTGHDQTRDEALAQRHREYLQNQLRDLPNYLMQQQQFLPTVPHGMPLEAHGTVSCFHYPMPPMGYFAPPPVHSMPPWHGGMVSSVPNKAASTRPDDGSPQLLPAFIPQDADKHTVPAPLPQYPATPPPTPPMHPLPPFIVGSITGAYLRMEAAKRRHLRERARREKSSLQDALPARRMALTEFMVKKRRGHNNALEEVHAWSSLPFAEKELDSECGAEEDVEMAETKGQQVDFSTDWLH